MNDPFVFTFPVWIISHDIAENTGFLGGMVLGEVKGKNAAAVFTDEDQARRFWESELADLLGSNKNKFTMRAMDPLAFLGLLTFLTSKGIAYLLVDPNGTSVIEMEVAKLLPHVLKTWFGSNTISPG